MIVTIWWEDARQAVRSKAYGPNQLLAQCVADVIGCQLSAAEKMFVGHPKKGAANVLAALREDAPHVVNNGPLCAVFDRDKVLDLWNAGQRPNDCKSGIGAAMRMQVTADFKLVLLAENMESLVEAACRVLQIEVPEKRPTERDRVLQHLTFGGTKDQRLRVRSEIDGFDRLVRWTIAATGKSHATAAKSTSP